MRTRPERPLGPPSLIYNVYRVSFMGLKWPGRGVYHPSPVVPRLKKEYSYTSTLPAWWSVQLEPSCHVDGQTETTKLVVVIRNCTNAHKNTTMYTAINAVI